MRRCSAIGMQTGATPTFFGVCISWTEVLNICTGILPFAATLLFDNEGACDDVDGSRSESQGYKAVSPLPHGPVLLLLNCVMQRAAIWRRV